MKHYEVEYHVKNHHESNWYSFSSFDTELEAYEFMLIKLEEKFENNSHKDIDQFRITFVEKRVTYNTWKLKTLEEGR